MKNFRKIVLAVGIASLLSPTSVSVQAEETYLYGTMNIPYADFYRAELADSGNVYEVDAVSSATTSKWLKNGEGELFDGSYNQANEDGTGTILGVTYPVAITQEDLDTLADSNYHFTALETKPDAYKIVTVTDGKAEFSVVQDETPETFEAVLKLNTETPWGDYLIDVETAPEDLGAIHGAILKTKEGNAYAMRHEQNIWRGEFAWSSGINTTEPHGNTLDYENFESLMGETVTEIVYITKSGYVTTVNDDLYIPVKFTNTLEVAESTAGTGTTELKMENFPDDYAPEFAISDQFTVSGNEVSYTDALPGSYTLQVSDNNQKYANFSTSFVLSTEDLPVAYDKEAGKLIPAEGSTEKDASNFIKNLSVVNLNDQDYTASGRGAVKIVGEDGTVDFNAENRGTAIFDGSGNYNLTFTATGYSNPLSVTLTAEQSTEAPTQAATEATTSSKNNMNTNNTTNRNTSGSNTSSNSSSNSSAATSNSANTSNTSDISATASPKTGDVTGIPLIALAVAGLT
ncbi:MAG: hypothetical protein K2O42_08465, partial [Oscillospiraceae bacterium]|nr:hypothetical protein [Oscillospiraceae bacterium]